ncbi:MAG: hypothetical protein D6797_03375 [Bdellovibrio sp.]|nr:MAG: hypothetical protein D6797_03375 [Bdellovibrio sp.]
MKNLLRGVLFVTLLAILTHIYLTLHYYDVNFGHLSGESFCNVSKTFNCDVVSASPYASLGGIPISLFGAFANTALFLMLLIPFLRLTENPNLYFKSSFLLSILIALASLVMIGISLTQLNTYCILCITAYVLSFLSLFLVWQILKQVDAPKISAQDIQNLFKQKGLLVIWLLIPLGAFFIHQSKLKSENLSNIQKIIKNFKAQWQISPEKEFTTEPLLSKGPRDSFMVIQEFADFQCIHCQKTYKPLKLFFQTHPDVRVEFFAFPLDGVCNKSVSFAPGTHCLLAKTVYCAGQQNMPKAWQLHDKIFDEFFKIADIRDPEQLKDFLKKLSQNLSLSWEPLNQCLESSETQEAIMAQAQQGDNVGVEGTPTIFINHKKISTHPVLLIKLFDSIYKDLKNK